MYQFYSTLLRSGQPIFSVESGQKVKDWLSQRVTASDPELIELLRDAHAEQSFDFPGAAPEFDSDAALWGLQTLYLLCASIAFRELQVAEIKSLLRSEMPNAETAEAHFSADLCLHYLCDTYKLISRIADGDPILSVIDELGLQAPLSSVGLILSSEPSMAVIESHPGLSQLHTERVLEHSDFARAALPSVASQIQTLLGDHASTLCPNPALIL